MALAVDMPDGPEGLEHPAPTGWGRPGVALVPAVLRAAWSGLALPAQLRGVPGLAEASWDDFDAGVWGSVAVHPAVVEGAVLAAVGVMFSPVERQRVGSLPVLESRWPVGLDSAVVPFRPHTFEVLVRLGARRSGQRLGGLTISQLLRARGGGVLTLLDFACTGGAAIAAASPHQAATADAELMALGSEEWAASVAFDDARFADLLGSLWPTTVAGMVATAPARAREGLSEVASQLRGRVQELATGRLEDALLAYLDALAGPKMAAERRAALAARLGLAGQPPLTLQEAAELVGLTSERIRQLEAQVRSKRSVACSRPYLPQLDSALSAVGDALPVPARGVGQVLAAAGVAAESFSADSLVSAAEMLGRQAPFVVANPGADAVLLDASRAPAAGRLERLCSVAHAQVRRYGATTLDELSRALAEDGICLPDDELAFVLSNCDDQVVVGDHGWLWFVDEAHSTLVQSSLRMLAVTSPLTVASLHDGLRRRYAGRGLRVLAPEAVLEQLYRSHPSFRVDEQARVRPARPADPETRPSTLDWRIIDILRAAPNQFLERTAIMDAADREGLNRTSVSVYLAYSECLERVAPEVYAPRGTPVNPSALSALQERLGTARPSQPGAAATSPGEHRPPLAISSVTPGEATVRGSLTSGAPAPRPQSSTRTSGPAVGGTIIVSSTSPVEPGDPRSAQVHVSFQSTVPIEACDPAPRPEDEPPS